MYIEEKLPQFPNQKSLILVSGRQEAILYLANNGQIWEKERIKVEDPGYSDKEGFFKSSNRTGGVMKAGSIYKEKITQQLTREYLNQVEENVKNILSKEELQSIYLFCPDYMKKEVLKKIPKSSRGLIFLTKQGNYIDSHPFDLLKSIQEDQQKEKEKVASPIKEKAQKILKKTTGFKKRKE